MKRFSFAKTTNSLPAPPRNNIIGKPFVELSSVDSTNNYAMRQVQNGLAEHGAAYFAIEQTKGKGQRTKQWQSTRGENIILSIVVNTSSFAISQQFVLSIISALSVLDLFNKYTTKKALIKWPNDIYFDDRKAAGILIENLIQGSHWRFAVIGFGVNINQLVFDASLKNPVSLKQITTEHYDVKFLAYELCSHLQRRLEQFESDKAQGMLAEYNNVLYRKNTVTRFKVGARIFSAAVKCVNKDGSLVVGDGFEESFEFGRIEWLIG